MNNTQSGFSTSASFTYSFIAVSRGDSSDDESSFQPSSSSPRYSPVKATTSKASAKTFVSSTTTLSELLLLIKSCNIASANFNASFLPFSSTFLAPQSNRARASFMANFSISFTSSLLVSTLSSPLFGFAFVRKYPSKNGIVSIARLAKHSIDASLAIRISSFLETIVLDFASATALLALNFAFPSVNSTAHFAAFMLHAAAAPPTEEASFSFDIKSSKSRYALAASKYKCSPHLAYPSPNFSKYCFCFSTSSVSDAFWSKNVTDGMTSSSTNFTSSSSPSNPTSTIPLCACSLSESIRVALT